MKTVDAKPLEADEYERIDRYWRACNYLSVGQIYLLTNPLLTEPLAPEHTKPRLLGHWGTTPGLNLLCAHLNRMIAARTRSASSGAVLIPDSYGASFSILHCP